MLPKAPGRPGRSRTPPPSAGKGRAPGEVRIIGGSLRGSKLPVPVAAGLRPTPDRVRETLFNWLRPRLPGARVLDLFAGSGALGLEAHSQGAGPVTLIEKGRVLAEQLRSQLGRLRVAAEAVTVVQADALGWLRDTPVVPVDLVLLDPPYGLDLWAPALALLTTRGWLRPEARIYLEWPLDQSAPAAPDGWVWARQTRAAGVAFGLLAEGSA